MRGKWNWIVIGLWVFIGSMIGSGFSVANAATYDATGTWTATVSGNWVSGDCEPAENETVTITITQTGDNFSVIIDGQEYFGTVSGATYTGSASYPENDGTTTTEVELTLTSDSEGSGTAAWSWVEDGMEYEYCNGGSNLRIVKGRISDNDNDNDDSGGSGCFINHLGGF